MNRFVGQEVYSYTIQTVSGPPLLLALRATKARGEKVLPWWARLWAAWVEWFD